MKIIYNNFLLTNNKTNEDHLDVKGNGDDV